MAEVPRYIAGVAQGGANQRVRSSAVYVSETDAKAYVAAADAAARAATKVGLLLAATQDLTRGAGQDYWQQYYLHAEFWNTLYAPPAVNSDLYNSDKFKVTYRTTNATVPATESIYICLRSTSVNMESDGVNVILSGAGASAIVTEYVTQLLDTGVSSFGTAITSVVSISVNDD